ncbi:MAG TPA: glycosyltransferase [Acidimicrobiales bacterium]
MGRLSADGTSLMLDGSPYLLRGVSYGTFRRRPDGHALPETDRMKRDCIAIAEAGFNTIRTYEEPSIDLLDLAADWNLKILAGVYYDDWRSLVGASARQRRRAAADARRQIGEAASRFADDERVAALVLGNELPADVVRWVGRRAVGELLRSLADAVADVDPGMLRTYGNYPTTEYLDTEGLDLVMFNVFLENPADLRRYLARLQNLAGDRPLILGELGIDSAGDPVGELIQSELIDRSLAVATERGVAGTCVFSWTDDWWVADEPVEGWQFGLTRKERTPRPALGAATARNATGVAGLRLKWPSMSVVVCAYNAAATLDECLAHTCALDYPELEILVVDDGSTDATARIAASHPRVRLITVEHGGLSAARNIGLQEARNDVVAYLDADAYPTPQWPYHLSLGFDEPQVVGVGGPNFGPTTDGATAAAVALAPGGPVHVLVSDDRAEHLPGCNMAFRRSALADAGGFDPVFETAGDDVDLCWRLLDRGGLLAFHAGAVVWHHRRSSVRGYLRQQRGYGRSEALVEARHPERFTALGSARWAGSIYGGPCRRLLGQRIYRGPLGTAPFQSLHGRPDHAVEIATQVGSVAATALVATAPVGLVDPILGLPAALGLLTLAFLVILNTPGRHRSTPVRLDRRHRLLVGVLSVLQPLARLRGRLEAGHPTSAVSAGGHEAVVPTDRAGRNVLVYDADRSRPDLVLAVVDRLRGAGCRIRHATDWDDYDVRVLAAPLAVCDIVSTDHPAGCIQVRLRRRLAVRRLAGAGALVAIAALMAPWAGAAAATATVLVLAASLWAAGPGLRRTLIGDVSA